MKQIEISIELIERIMKELHKLPQWSVRNNVYEPTKAQELLSILNKLIEEE